jgi:hypothetical protein
MVVIFNWSQKSICFCVCVCVCVCVVGLSQLGTAATSGLLYKPQMIDEGDCGAIGGMKIGRGSRSTRRKPAPTPLCPPQIPHDQTQARTRAAAVESQRLTAWAMAQPKHLLVSSSTFDFSQHQEIIIMPFCCAIQLHSLGSEHALFWIPFYVFTLKLHYFKKIIIN